MSTTIINVTSRKANIDSRISFFSIIPLLFEIYTGDIYGERNLGQGLHHPFNISSRNLESSVIIIISARYLPNAISMYDSCSTCRQERKNHLKNHN
jgi:hypothetical protein